MKKFPLVVIVIVNWNKKEMTGDCLKSLKITSYPNYKIILVDNGSKDGSIDYLKGISDNLIILKLSENKGYTVGTNQGWKYALGKLKADYICALDNDIVTVQKEWLTLLVAELEKSAERGIASGKHLFPNGILQTPFEGIATDEIYKRDEGKFDFVKEVDAFVGPCILIKKSTIKKIGYYDENFFYGPNDIDYCNRARKAGIKIVYNGFSKSIHLGSISGKSKGDWLFGKQVEGMLIFTFRYGSFPAKIAMILRQFIRAFVGRIDTLQRRRLSNLYFHKTFLIRIVYFIKGLINALENQKIIKTSNSNNTIEKWQK